MKRTATTLSVALLLILAGTAVALAKSSPQLRHAHPAPHSVRVTRHHAAR